MLRRAVVAALLLSIAAFHAEAGADVCIAFGESLDPYVMDNASRGIEVDIIRAAFQARGIRIHTASFSQPRLPAALDKKDIDAVATLGSQSGVKAFFSEVYIAYEDEAITLSERHLVLKNPHDMEHLNVLAFSHARSYLGPAFADMASHNPHYGETADQLDQARMLYRGLVDVVIADRYIFRLMSDKQAETFKEKVLPVDEHHLFPPTTYQLACRTAQLCDTFNQGLNIIRENGKYQQIIDQYR
jgi:ABC-type amino acid transport substrate-binding protein